MKNPYKNYTDKELCNIILDMQKSKSNGKRIESLVPYATDIKNNINGTTELITLRETLEMAKQDFYDVVCERFMNITYKEDSDKIFKLQAALKNSGIDNIEDDQEFIERENEFIREYCIKHKFQISQEDMAEIKSRGMADTFVFWKEEFNS